MWLEAREGGGASVPRGPGWAERGAPWGGHGAHRRPSDFREGPMPTFPCERWSVVEMCPSSSPAGPGPPCGPCSAWSPCPVPSPLWPLGSGPLFVPPTFLSQRPLRAQASCVLSLARGSSSVGPRRGGSASGGVCGGSGGRGGGRGGGPVLFLPASCCGPQLSKPPPCAGPTVCGRPQDTASPARTPPQVGVCRPDPSCGASPTETLGGGCGSRRGRGTEGGIPSGLQVGRSPNTLTALCPVG